MLTVSENLFFHILYIGGDLGEAIKKKKETKTKFTESEILMWFA